MAETKLDPYANVVRFVLSEKLLTIAVIGSIITFQFVSNFKTSLIDPLLDFALPSDKFGFMNITLREGDEIITPNPKITMDWGNFFREFLKWLIGIMLLFLLAKYTQFPDTKYSDGTRGNATGAAIM